MFDKEDIGELLDGLTDMIREMLKRDELFQLGAQVTKKTYDALVEAGFSEEQAATIVANQGNMFAKKS